MGEKINYELMDQVVSTTIANFLVECARNNGLAFKNFDSNNINHKYGFEVGFIVSTSIYKPLYLDMGWFDYLKFKLNNWAIRKHFVKLKNKDQIKPIELEVILDFMKTSMDLEEDIFEKIYKAYYEDSNENRSIYRWKFKR